MNKKREDTKIEIVQMGKGLYIGGNGIWIFVSTDNLTSQPYYELNRLFHLLGLLKSAVI